MIDLGSPQHSLPPNWKWAKLEDVCTVTLGQSPPGSTYRSEPSGLPFLQGKADFGARHPVPTKWCVKPQKIAEAGDILISVRAPVGPTNIANVRCCIGRGLASLRCLENLDRDFLAAYLKLCEPRIAELGSGSTFSAITGQQLKDIEVPLPPLPEQKRIVAVLNEQLAAVERSKKAAAERLEAAQALRDVLLRRTFNEGDETAKAKYNQVPLRNTCTVVTGTTPTKSNPKFYGGSVPWVNPSRIGTSKYVSDSDEYLTDEGLLSARLVPKGAVLVVCISGSRNNIGKASIAGRPLTTNQQINTVIPGPHVDSEFLYYHLLAIKPELESLAASTNQNIVNKSRFEDVLVQLPPLATQQRIAAKLNDMFRVITSAELSAGYPPEQINILSQTLLSRAFSGEV